MRMTIKFLQRSLSVAFLAIVCTGCASLLDNTAKNQEADTQIAAETDAVCRKIDELYAESIKLINLAREESLNAEREKASARMLAEARDRYLGYAALAKEIEREDRNRLNDPSRYYEIVTHKWPERTKEWGTQTGSRSNWTLVMSGDGPLTDNGLYRGVTFYTTRFKGRTEGLVAYAVVLTPVIKADIVRKGQAASGDAETDNLATMLGVNGTGPGSYRYPCKGHLRTQYQYGITSLYAVRAAVQINLREEGGTAAKWVPTSCMSDGLLYSPRSFSYNFSTPLAAFKGDIVAVMIPSDNYLAYATVSKDADGASLPPDQYFAITEGTVKALAKGAAPKEEGAVITLKAPFKKTCRAAFAFYGDYLMPGN